MRTTYLQRLLFSISFLCFGICSSISAQTSADKIVAVVGKSRIILQSEVSQQETQMRKQYGDFSDSMRCLLVQQLIMQKLLAEQAERDSVIVSDEEVEASIDNRIRYFMQGYGSKEALETAAGKTIYQLKDDFREFTKEEMLAERMKSEIVNDVKVTPVEVTAFFKEAALDTLPYMPGTVEVGQIILEPAFNDALDKYARDKIEDIRKDVVENGKNFEAMAGLYSQDPGSRDNGGDLGNNTKNDYVPEFSNAAFKLKDGEISPVVKTKFGYHIIQMVKRYSETAHLRHILITSEHTSGDYAASLSKLDSIRNLLVDNKISFAEAVGKFTEDEASKMSGGLITDMQSGSSHLTVDQLDPVLAIMMDTMKVGNYSTPHLFVNPKTGNRVARIVYLRSKTEPHQANLKDDYNQIQELALDRKRAQKMDKWVSEKIPSFYINIDPEYASCQSISKWTTKEKQ